LAQAPSPSGGHQSLPSRSTGGASSSGGDAQRLQQLPVPAAAVAQQQAAPGRDRRRRRQRPAELRPEVIAEGAEARRGTEHLRLLLPQPEQLGRPEAGVERAAGAGMHGLRVQPLRQLRGLCRGARVLPGEDRRQRPAAPVEREQRVPEARDRDRPHRRAQQRLAHLPRGLDDLSRVELGRPARPLPDRVADLPPAPAQRPRVVAVDDPARRGAADVDREYACHSPKSP
jgi:hypothetical protein